MVAKDPEADRSRAALKLTAEVRVKGCRLPSGERLSARVSGAYVENPGRPEKFTRLENRFFPTFVAAK